MLNFVQHLSYYIEIILFLVQFINFYTYFGGVRYHRSSRQEVFYKKGVLTDFAKLHNTSASVSFLIKLQTSRLQLYWERDSGTGVFLWILLNLKKHLFLQNTSDGCFWHQLLFHYVPWSFMFLIGSKRCFRSSQPDVFCM